MSGSIWQSNELKLRYELLETIAESGDSHVYKVHDQYLDIDVAIKVLKPGLADKNLVQFQNEAKIAGSLVHKNIQNVLDFGLVEKTHPYLVLDFIDGKSLSQRLKQKGPLPAGECIDIFAQICNGMAFAHRKNVLHRDIKPSNIMLTVDEDNSTLVKIVDFGLARFKPVDSSDTPTKGLIGTPLYMAPEQADGVRSDKLSDIYSMGCLMYECLAGKPPFVGDSPANTIMLHRTENPAPFEETLEVPDFLEQAVFKCLSKDSSDRFSDFDQLYEALFSSSEFEHFKPSDDGQRVGKREKLIRVCSGLVLVLTPLLLAIYVYAPKRSGTRPKIEQKPPQFLEAGKVQDEKPFIVGRAIDSKKLKLKATFGFTDTRMIERLKHFKKIDILEIENAIHFSGEGLKQFDWLSVEDLRVQTCPINKKGLSELARINGLRTFYLEKAYLIKDEDLKVLKDAKNLTWFIYSGRNFTEESFKYLAEYSSAQSFQPKKLKISAKGINYLDNKKSKLTGVDLRECVLTDDAILAMTRLQKPLNIGIWSVVTDKQLKILANAKKPTWRYMRLQCAPQSPEAVKDLSKIKNLTQLKIPSTLKPSLLAKIETCLTDVKIAKVAPQTKGNKMQTIMGIIDKDEGNSIAEFEMSRTEK